MLIFLIVQVAIPLHDSRGKLMHPEYVHQVQKLKEEIDQQFPGEQDRTLSEDRQAILR